MGTGSGCLLLSVLSELKEAHGIGVDISPGALQIATENARHHSLTDRAAFRLLDFTAPSVVEISPIFEHRFELIISNPPYIATHEKPELEDTVIKYEPHLALFAKNNGLSFYTALAKHVTDWIAQDGFLVIEIGKDQKEDVIPIFENQRFVYCTSHLDYGGIERCLVFQLKNP